MLRNLLYLQYIQKQYYIFNSTFTNKIAGGIALSYTGPADVQE